MDSRVPQCSIRGEYRDVAIPQSHSKDNKKGHPEVTLMARKEYALMSKRLDLLACAQRRLNSILQVQFREDIP